MEADIILGRNIGTDTWIFNLKKRGAKNIFVVDYDYCGKVFLKDEVKYLSALEANEYFGKFSLINYYKSMYGYPGTSGKMKSLFEKED